MPFPRANLVILALTTLAAQAEIDSIGDNLPEYSHIGLDVPAGPPWSGQKHLELIVKDVHEIGAPGIPGPLCVFGGRCLIVGAGKIDGGALLPVVATSESLGEGRLAAFGHTGYFEAATLETADSGRLMLNIIQWAARQENAARPRVGVHGAAGFREWLTRQQVAAESLDAVDSTQTLKDFDVVCLNCGDLSDRDAKALSTYVKRGGGLVAVSLGWGWLQLHPGKSLQDHPGNRLFGQSGIVWADGYLDRTCKAGFAIAPLPELLSAQRAVVALMGHAEGRRELTPGDMIQASAIASLAARNLPPNDKLLRPRIGSFKRTEAAARLPTEQTPLKVEDALARFFMTFDLTDVFRADAATVVAHPAAEAFPGGVTKKAERMTHGLTIDTRIRGWRSTGAYAAPGETVEVSIDRGSFGAVRNGLRFRIGAHTDELWDKSEWKRAPAISRVFPVSGRSTQLASPFGGLVFVEVGDDCSTRTVQVQLKGTVKSPHFLLGATSGEAFRELLQKAHAPWGELESRKVVLTLPSPVLRKLEDPEVVMEHWDAVSDAAADLAGIPREKTRPHRFVPDVQISAGYMHSGYPIMTHMDVCEAFVDLKALRDPDKAWGFYHELGHNHQSGDWTFDGTGEVTCNLFTLYILDTVCGVPPAKTRMNAEACEKLTRDYFEKGAKYEDWKRDPFLALVMYVQMQEAFGWDAYKEVFAEYRDLKREERPKNDDEKRDQWMTRMSKAVGKNLGPFFEVWGVPTSEAARKSISKLPDWMPKGVPPK